MSRNKQAPKRIFYPDSKYNSLDGLNFKINPGELIAIVGPVGCGKTTLAKSLGRTIEIPNGQLFLDNIDIKDIKLSYQGISPNLDKRNVLNIDLDFLLIKESKPLVYQLIKGDTILIDCEYKINNNIVSFHLKSNYNKKHDLIIDPIVFSTYSGSYSNNFGYSSTYDELGFLYSAGTAFDIGYPTTLELIRLILQEVVICSSALEQI